ncbi:ribosome biogenesis-related protein SDA1 [Parastagonospora nodorum]|uniref:Protein SDA1 n=1 Tax=Phaeosphaeria nodorum (strain SN15 / ATCC MYA-4574 / FGSC 10173) TaxID=321614 RepID=A0A7U2HVK8_PHANO|nr:ribosome biogenesis-related protein SDA1 [Parastagonospora nodorum]QRC92308.1 ribosome biogenesis-related protein SDA1 [Parastagonospora nodorum SN15]KAH3925058.1 ribosome biogenesis-related protein SDA1 [Parastagonospora nodorum]KAH3954425.1 ribosome biogenesis-related protein SDA1 [Parastagonospora nodorum]KAH3963719.1 ribosome biogenesis-related protein SDA1 [Parastagonospora nodorum]
MKRKVGALEKIEADHAALRYKLKRDPQSYRDDFNNQYQQYETLRDLFLQNPSATDSGLVALKDLIEFISHVADRYPDLTSKFPGELAQILLQHHEVLEYDLRDKIVGSIVLLRNKDVIDSTVLLNTLFPILVSTPSKSLRQLLFTKILSDLRSSNVKATNHKLNRTIQTVLYNLLESDKQSPKGIWAVKIAREMWKRQIWTDARAVEVMRLAALSDNEKVITGGVRFFLGGDKEREEAAEDSDDDEDVDIARLRHQVGINKKSKKNQRDLRKASIAVKKKQHKKNAPHPLNFSALHLLHDPQGFAEQLFSKHVQNSKSKLQLESKLLVLQLVSRLVGLHKLTVLSLYSFFLKHLTPRQASVTSYLACLAQATHNYVPPDVLEPLVQKIANEFVSEASASEVAAAGLNAIREICVRQPLAMTDTLLQDLVQYRKSKDKGTMMAAKGLLSLYREVGADLLHKRDRGKDAAMGIRAGTIKERRYGEEAVGEVEGIELLEKWKEEERRKKREAAGLDPDADDGEEPDETEDWKAWDVESDEESDDSGGWINVESDGEDIQISDSEDEKDKSKAKAKQPPAKKRKLSNATTDAADDKKSEEPEIKSISKLLTTTILTPADLKQLRALQEASAISSSLPSHKRAQLLAARHADEAITAETIEAAASLGKKNTKEEKIAMAKGDRETNHQSTTAKRKEKKIAEGKSTTNKEKARKKNFLMTLSKAKSKNKRSLTDVKKTLAGHIDRSKRGGKRGNKGN